MVENRKGMEPIKLNVTILKPVQKVWEYFTQPEHITHWHFATEEWKCPSAKSDLREGGRFVYRMEAKDGSFGFDYSGIFDEIVPEKHIVYTLDDDRKVHVVFNALDPGTTEINQTFEPEKKNSVEMQRDGWDKILHNFEKYAENHK